MAQTWEGAWSAERRFYVFLLYLAEEEALRGFPDQQSV